MLRITMKFVSLDVLYVLAEAEEVCSEIVDKLFILEAKLIDKNISLLTLLEQIDLPGEKISSIRTSPFPRSCKINFSLEHLIL